MAPRGRDHDADGLVHMRTVERESLRVSHLCARGVGQPLRRNHNSATRTVGGTVVVRASGAVLGPIACGVS